MKGELYQNRMNKITGSSYRNILRQLQLLEKAGLIRIARKEPSSKRGKEKNVWKLTFSGLMSVFACDSMGMFAIDKEIDEIAEALVSEKITSLDAMLKFCDLCMFLRTGELICDWHKVSLSIPDSCKVCTTDMQLKTN